jgi:AcrR family transcriptional regulator
LAEFASEDVAAGAGVTGNLLYHYFPRRTAVG